MKNYLKIFYMSREQLNMKIKAAFIIILLLSTSIMKSETPEPNQNSIVVVGLVRNAKTKLPVSAAQISVPNKGLSVVTDDKGKFSIKLSSSNDVLHVVAYDYNPREIPVKGRDSIVIELYSNQFSSYFKKIDGLSGTLDNSALVTSIKSIDDFSSTHVVAADELIQSELGGDVRSVSRSGISGIGSSLFIRGINSLNANAQPLFVVDGVIWNNMYDVQSIFNGFYSNPLDNIDINDIENIRVVKDGTSIYGSKGSNGVILIKTRRSKTMVTKISLNIFSGLTTNPGTLPMMDGEQFRLYASDMLHSQGVSGIDISRYSFLQTHPSSPDYNTYHNVTDWSKEIYQMGSTNNYLINANGGDEKAMYYFSLGYTDNKGVVKNTDLKRYNARFNADFNLIKAFKMGLNIGFSRVERKLMDDGVNANSSPTWVSKIKSPFLSPFAFTSTGEKTLDFARTDSLGIGNPNGIIKFSQNSLKKYRFNIGAHPVYQITPEISVGSLFDYSIDKTIEGRYVPLFFTPSRLIPNYGISYNEINSQVMRNIGIFDDTRITYEKKLNSLNKIKAILGWRYISNYYESDYSEEHNSGTNNNTTITGGYQYLQVSGINNRTKSISNYLNADYNFDNRYFLTGTVAVDGSSKFGNNTVGGLSLFGHSWGVFPAINGAWLMSSESFMKNISFIDFFKLRAGYGITGNDGISDYQTMAYFSSIRYLDRANGLVLSNLQNTEIQWETTGKANVGVDVNLFNDRLSLTFDYFSGKTTDLIVMKNLPQVSGLGYYWANDGTLTNNGFEISANVKALNLKNFKWELGVSTGHYKNKITSLPNGEFVTKVYDGEVISRVGEAAGSFYGYISEGVFSTQAAAEASELKVQNSDGTFSYFGGGDVIFRDVDGNKIINEADKKVIGNPNPDFYGSFSSKMCYKRFELNALFTYSYGNDVYNYQRSQLESGKGFENQTSAMLNRWTADGQTTFQPKAVYNDPMGNSRFSSRWIEDGSYLRLKTVSLSYNLPIKSDYIEGINIWVSADNVMTLTKYLGLDPEFSAQNSVYYQGVDAGLIPLTRGYYVGLKFNL